jgi:hypothetical protein
MALGDLSMVPLSDASPAASAMDAAARLAAMTAIRKWRGFIPISFR